MIERRILIGLITNTTYLKQVRPLITPQLIASSTARMLVNWTLKYYDKYKQAPESHIEDIFYKRLKEGLPKDVAEEIEQDILPELSEEYEQDSNVDTEYLVEETVAYLKRQHLLNLSEQIEATIENGIGDLDKRIQDAEQLARTFKTVERDKDETLDLSKPESNERIRKAFEKLADPIVEFPKQLGQFWNHVFVPGGFIAFLAPEKRGKTYLLLEIAMRALRQGRKVAMFQAGDMNEGDQLKRIAMYLTKKNTLEKYCKDHFEATRDCIRNQFNKCQKKERECDFGLWTEKEKEDYHKFKMQDFISKYTDNEDYRPCYNCEEYDRFKLGTNWIKPVEGCEPLTVDEAEKAIIKFFQENKRQFKIDTHPSNTLSFNKAEAQLDKWEGEDGFVPDIILFDYIDIMLAPDTRKQVRDQENDKWKQARKLSQKERQGILPLVIIPTQSDADSYKKDRLRLENFSEDKRKYAHTTAFYGLNQDRRGIEKSFGLLVINELLLREGDFSCENTCTLIQNLRQGRPLKGSYFARF